MMLDANRKILGKVNHQLHLLKQGKLPPELKEGGLKIFGTVEKAIEGYTRAREADKLNLEHIVKTYEELEKANAATR